LCELVRLAPSLALRDITHTSKTGSYSVCSYVLATRDRMLLDVQDTCVMNLLPKLNNLRLQTWPTSIEFIMNLWNNYNNVFINQTANVGLPVDDIEFKKLGPWGDRDRWGEVDSAGSG